MCDNIIAPYLTMVIAFILCLPARSEVRNETKRQRSLVLELKNMISELFDKNDVTENEDKLLRDRKSADEDRPTNYRRVQADNLRKQGIDDVTLMPLYPCDEFDEGRRYCTNIRQIGTTLTFGIHTDAYKDVKRKYIIRWFRFFKVFKSESEIKEELTTEKKPWNINFGEDNSELRISPITETDYRENYFVAFLVKDQADQKSDKLVNLHYLKFYIQPLAIDMGTLYHGEELFINVRSFIELPESSISFDWTQSNLDKTNNFPRNTRHVSSNMKKNTDGSTLIIKEFMDSTDKILSCNVYSNKNVFIARRDFFLRKIAEPDDSEKDLTEEVVVAHKRKRRSLQENYEYVSYSDKDEQELGDSYAPEDDVKVVRVDSPVSKKTKKFQSARFNDKPSFSKTRELKYNRHYRLTRAPVYRENLLIAPFYGKQSPSLLSYNAQSNQNLDRFPEKSLRRPNERSPVSNIIDSRYHRSYGYSEESPNTSVYSQESSNRLVYGVQPPNALGYGEKTLIEPIYGEQSPSALTYGPKPLMSATNGEQSSNALAYGTNPLMSPAFAYGEELSVPTYKAQPSNVLDYGEKPLIAPSYSEQLPSAFGYGETKLKTSTYGEQVTSAFSPDGNPDPAMLKSPYLKTLINQANNLAHSPTTQKTVKFRRVYNESQDILTFDDMESRLISSCTLDYECGIHAICYSAVSAQTAALEPMFCRCKSDYVGNGIFCWLF